MTIGRRAILVPHPDLPETLLIGVQRASDVDALYAVGSHAARVPEIAATGGQYLRVASHEHLISGLHLTAWLGLGSQRPGQTWSRSVDANGIDQVLAHQSCRLNAAGRVNHRGDGHPSENDPTHQKIPHSVKPRKRGKRDVRSDGGSTNRVNGLKDVADLAGNLRMVVYPGRQTYTMGGFSGEPPTITGLPTNSGRSRSSTEA